MLSVAGLHVIPVKVSMIVTYVLHLVSFLFFSNVVLIILVWLYLTICYAKMEKIIITNDRFYSLVKCALITL